MGWIYRMSVRQKLHLENLISNNLWKKPLDIIKRRLGILLKLVLDK